MSSLVQKYKCGYCGWLIWNDKDGKIAHSCFANCEEIIMDAERNLFRNDSLEAHSHVTNETDENIACIEEGTGKHSTTSDNSNNTLTPITNDISVSPSPVPPTSTKSKKRKMIDLDDYEEVNENEYTNVFIVENKKKLKCIQKILLINKINEWKRTHSCWQKEMRRKQLVIICLQYLRERKKKEKKQPKLWVRSIFTEEKRNAQGDSGNLIREMANDDSAKYFEYLRMTKESFNELLELVESKITKEHVVRTPIPAATRLQICLRYLASGDTMHSISFAFRVGLNTTSKIIAETCNAIWEVLKEKVFPEITEDLWIQKAKEFELLQDFPNCIGAIDGKHVQIQAPPKSGSTFYNYKGTHSIVLMALADANCCFTIVDIGAEGRRSDGGILQNSELGRLLEDNLLRLPKASLISDKGPQLPYVIIGDEAFALKNYMLRPYPRRGNLNIEKKIFNYRLSRARRTVECAFGILTSRWRIFLRPIATSISTAISIIKATVCLHNFLMTSDLARPVKNRLYSANISYKENRNEYLQNLQISTIEDDTNCSGSTIRDLFMEYFCTSGAVKQQWDKAKRNNF